MHTDSALSKFKIVHKLQNLGGCSRCLVKITSLLGPQHDQLGSNSSRFLSTFYLFFMSFNAPTLVCLKYWPFHCIPGQYSAGFSLYQGKLQNTLNRITGHAGCQPFGPAVCCCSGATRRPKPYFIFCSFMSSVWHVLLVPIRTRPIHKKWQVQ